MARERPKFLLMYASQTGQAQAIAEEITENAASNGLSAEMHCMSMTDKKFSLERVKLVVIITSTTGDGEPPETSLKFWRRLKKKTLPKDHLSSLKYALLGLGDTNYTNFCRCGKTLDSRLQELGASRFYSCGWADDATGLEIVVEPWMEGLWQALRDNISTEVSTEAQTNGVPPDNIPVVVDSLRNVTSRTDAVKEESFSPKAVLGTDVHVVHVPLSNGISDVGKVHNGAVNNAGSLDSAGSGEKTAESLTYSSQPLSESALTLPRCPPSYLSIQYNEATSLDLTTLPVHNNAALPTCASSVSMVTVTRAERLSAASGDVRKSLLISLDVSDCQWNYMPGDSFSIVCPNSPDEVQFFIDRLGCADIADVPYSLSVMEGTKKKFATVPAFIPTEATVRHVLTNCCDIRKVPKKAFVRALVEHTAGLSETRRLQELCSKQGAPHYGAYIREPALGVMDLLMAFPSCLPPIATVLEHLERLQPRPYSIASSPLATPGCVDIVFNLVEIGDGDGRYKTRQGVCTGWLDRLTSDFQQKSMNEHSSVYLIEDGIQELSMQSPNLSKIPVYLRTNQHFHPPADPSVPVIMIGPGTGVAPFIGFLRHRKSMIAAQSGGPVGDAWLFFGCRHKDKDYLFRGPLKEFVAEGVLSKLCVSFSRDEHETAGGPRYVQDNIREHGERLVSLVTERDARVYVCGDAKNMAKGVNAAFAQILQKHKDMNEKDALAFLMSLRINKRYLEDVWT